MSWPMDCANCGKQVLMDGVPDEKCIWCGKSPYRKEVTIVKQTNKTGKMSAVVRHRFIEEHQEEITEDIGKLPVGEVLEKWHIGLSTYYKLQRMKTGQQPPPPQADKEPPSLTEHERYLVLLGYQMAVREVLKADKKSRLDDPLRLKK